MSVALQCRICRWCHEINLILRYWCPFDTLLYSLTIRHHVWRDWGFSVLPSRFVKRPACTQRVVGARSWALVWKRVCVVIHVRWGTGVPRYVRDPGASRRSSPSCRDPHQRPICVYVCMPFVQRRSIHIRSNLMGLVCRAKLRKKHRYDPGRIRSPTKARSAIMGFCYHDDAQYIICDDIDELCTVAIFSQHDRNISKTLTSY